MNYERVLRLVETASIWVALAAGVSLLVFAGLSPSAPSLAANSEVEAHAFAMPNQGWAPLHVYFSAFGTKSEGGRIASYRWDLDGDGMYETDATVTGGYVDRLYVRPGTVTVGLEVTTEYGERSMAELQVEVRHPGSSSVDYWTVFDDSRVQKVELLVTRASWELLNRDPGAKVQVEADARIFGKRLNHIGLSPRGNFSLLNANEKIPLKIDTDDYVPGQEFYNLKQLLFINNFGDTSMIKEKLVYDMLAFAGVPASHLSFVEIWVDITDDEAPPVFLGVYSMVERVDMKFIANRFGADSKGGNLYKANHFRRGPSDLIYHGESIEDYPMPHGVPAYGKVNHEEEADYSDVINLCRVVDGTRYATTDDFRAALEQVFNADTFLRYLAVEMTIMSWDIYPNTGNNFYLYNNPQTGRFEWIPWDQTWGENVSQPLFEMPANVFRLVERAPLFDRVLEVPEYRLAYAAYIDLLLRNWFTEVNMTRQAEHWYELISPSVRKGDKFYSGPTAFHTIQDFQNDWTRIGPLVRSRGEFIKTQLQSYDSAPSQGVH